MSDEEMQALAERMTQEMPGKKGWYVRRKEEDYEDSSANYDRYTSTGEEYEIDSDGCEYIPSWLQ